MSGMDKRHKETIKKIRLIMKAICNDVLSGKKMPSFDITKIGYDNTVWSEEKRMLTVGTKTVHISPDTTKKIPTFSQYVVMSNAVRKLLDEQMESTIRGMYYATLSTVGDERNRQKFCDAFDNAFNNNDQPRWHNCSYKRCKFSCYRPGQGMSTRNTLSFAQ